MLGFSAITCLEYRNVVNWNGPPPICLSEGM